MLFSVFDASMAFAVPVVTSDISYFQTETTHVAQADDVGFAARAPLLAAANVDVTGGVTVKQGSAFALHGQETVAVLFGFGDDLNDTNRTPRTVGNLQGGPLENATQVRERFDFERGPANGTVYRADNQGNITSYATYDANGQILTRVDVTGAAHNGIPTPHTVVYGRFSFVQSMI